MSEVNEETNELERLKQTNKLLISKVEQLTQEIVQKETKLADYKKRVIPPWLHEDYVVNNKIVITANRITQHTNVYYPVKLKVKYILFRADDKPMKLPKVYYYPKLYLKFEFYDDKFVNCNLVTSRFKPYRCAHSNGTQICATFNSNINSLESFERAIKFIQDSFDTLNLTSMYTHRWHKSFKMLVVQINNDIKSTLPSAYKCPNCGNILASSSCITYYIRDASLISGCYRG